MDVGDANPHIYAHFGLFPDIAASIKAAFRIPRSPKAASSVPLNTKARLQLAHSGLALYAAHNFVSQKCDDIGQTFGTVLAKPPLMYSYRLDGGRYPPLAGLLACDLFGSALVAPRGDQIPEPGGFSAAASGRRLCLRPGDLALALASGPLA